MNNLLIVIFDRVNQLKLKISFPSAASSRMLFLLNVFTFLFIKLLEIHFK